MRMKKPAAPVFAALVLTALFVGAGPATAQVLSKWGHPVITFGWTPYDSMNAGHGNYIGGPGFIPGYGYYPGPGPDHYPWMDGPDTPFDRRKIAPAFPGSLPAGAGPLPLPGGEPTPRRTAVLIVKLPAEAELWIDGSKTSQGGSYRRFVSPPLAGDRKS